MGKCGFIPINLIRFKNLKFLLYWAYLFSPPSHLIGTSFSIRVENWFLICVFFDSDAQLSCLLMHVEWLWSFYKKLNEIRFRSSKNWENLTKVIEIFCEVLMKENGQKGSFQLLDLIIPELKSHVIPYKFKCSDWWKIYL